MSNGKRPIQPRPVRMCNGKRAKQPRPVWMSNGKRAKQPRTFWMSNGKRPKHPRLGGKRFANNEKVQSAVYGYFAELDSSHYKQGIEAIDIAGKSVSS
jgi:hypothetical protein